MSHAIADLIALEECKTLEFKRNASSPKPILKSLVAFANTAGGRLIIGVDDEKRPVGVENPLDEEERLCSLIADSISPRLVPNIEEIGMRLRFTIYLSQSHIIAPTDKSPTQSPTQSNEKVRQLLCCLQNGEKSAGELREMLGLKHRPTFRENYLHPALKQGLIEPTIPDKPNSRLQKYRLVEHS